MKRRPHPRRFRSRRRPRRRRRRRRHHRRRRVETIENCTKLIMRNNDVVMSDVLHRCGGFIDVKEKFNKM